MSWSTAFRLRQFALGSLWLLPLAGGLLGVLLGSGLALADQSVHMPSYWTYSASTASTVLSAMVGAMAALTGFVVTVTVLVVQMATGTFSARYMRLWYRDGVLKILLALLVGTFAYSFVLLQRIENNLVPNLGVSIAGLLVLSSLLLFVFFLDRARGAAAAPAACLRRHQPPHARCRHDRQQLRSGLRRRLLHGRLSVPSGLDRIRRRV